MISLGALVVLAFIELVAVLGVWGGESTAPEVIAAAEVAMPSALECALDSDTPEPDPLVLRGVFPIKLWRLRRSCTCSRTIMIRDCSHAYCFDK